MAIREYIMGQLEGANDIDNPDQGGRGTTREGSAPGCFHPQAALFWPRAVAGRDRIAFWPGFLDSRLMACDGAGLAGRSRCHNCHPGSCFLNPERNKNGKMTLSKIASRGVPRCFMNMPVALRNPLVVGPIADTLVLPPVPGPPLHSSVRTGDHAGRAKNMPVALPLMALAVLGYNRPTSCSIAISVWIIRSSV